MNRLGPAKSPYGRTPGGHAEAADDDCEDDGDKEEHRPRDGEADYRDVTKVLEGIDSHGALPPCGLGAVPPGGGDAGHYSTRTAKRQIEGRRESVKEGQA